MSAGKGQELETSDSQKKHPRTPTSMARLVRFFIFFKGRMDSTREEPREGRTVLLLLKEESKVKEGR